MIKAILLQSLFSLSDRQLEEQLIDRLSFQRFAGINLDQKIPNFTTFWRFKEYLARHDLDQRIFELINHQLKAIGLMVKSMQAQQRTSARRASVRVVKNKAELLAIRVKSQIRNRLRFVFAYKV